MDEHGNKLYLNMGFWERLTHKHLYKEIGSGDIVVHSRYDNKEIRKGRWRMFECASCKRRHVENTMIVQS